MCSLTHQHVTDSLISFVTFQRVTLKSKLMFILFSGKRTCSLFICIYRFKRDHIMKLINLTNGFVTFVWYLSYKIK